MLALHSHERTDSREASSRSRVLALVAGTSVFTGGLIYTVTRSADDAELKPVAASPDGREANHQRILRLLPETIECRGGSAEVRTFPVENSRFLIIVIRRFHPPKGRAATPMEEPFIEDSDRDVAAIVTFLQERCGVSMLGVEGHSVRANDEVARTLQTLRDMKERYHALGVVITERELVGMNASIERKDRDLLRAQTQAGYAACKKYFSGAVDAALNGTLQVMPIEDPDAFDAASALPPSTNGGEADVIKLQNRECGSLSVTSSWLKKMGRDTVVEIWGSDHWGKGEECPKHLVEFNAANPLRRTSLVVITPPTVAKVYR